MTVLSQLLHIDRYLPPKGRRGDFVLPFLGEVGIQGQDPLLVTNTRGGFVQSRSGQTGVARFGFTVCPQEEEHRLLGSLYAYLSEAEGTPRCMGVQSALDHLEGLGLKARGIVVSAADASAMLGPDTSVLDGLAGTVGGMQVFVTDLPRGAGLVAVAPDQLGIYTRVLDHLGLLFQRVDQNLVVVCDVAG